MYSITKQHDGEYGLIECIIDSVVDLTTLPSTWKPGSTCLCISNSEVYVFGTDKRWHTLGDENKGSEAVIIQECKHEDGNEVAY